MGWIKLKERLISVGAKYKYVLLVLLLGIFLMTMPQKSEQKEQNEPVLTQHAEADLAKRLESILGKMEGVGSVRVLLTESASAQTIYQTDEDRGQDGSLRVETVIITNENRGEEGLVSTITPPTYLGAIVVCQGADRPSVQLSVIRAVSNVTGISSDRIVVVKMK